MTNLEIQKSFENKGEIQNESKEKRKELSKEKLQIITNHEFLRLSPENRLQYITKHSISSNDLVKENLRIKNIEFTFTFNGKFNRELWFKTTAGQVLPSDVGEVKSNGITYKRNGLKGEFFAEANRRLIINEGTKIEISKLRTPEEIKKIRENNNEKLIDFIEKNEEYKNYEDIVKEAIARNIDPKFAIIAFKNKVDKTNNIFERLVLIEEMFTEYDRKKGELSLLNKNAGDGLKVLILREFAGEDWKQKAKEFGIKEEVIKNYEFREYSTREFFNKAKELSKKIEEKYGIPRQVVLGMSLLESANGQSKLTKIANNAFGHKAKAGQISVSMMTGEYRNGSYGKELANFRAFNTLEESFEAYAQLLTRSSRYRNSFNYKNNPERFLYEVIKAGYATLAPEKYVANVKARLKYFGESLA